MVGSGGLTKTGSGTLVIASNSSYSGPTVIHSGTVQLQSGLSLAGNLANYALNIDASTLPAGSYGSVANSGTQGGSFTSYIGNGTGNIAVGGAGGQINGRNALQFAGGNALASALMGIPVTAG